MRAHLRVRRCGRADAVVAGAAVAAGAYRGAAVTEIPEHLLKRSRDRRAALGLGGCVGGRRGARRAVSRPARGDAGDDAAERRRRPHPPARPPRKAAAAAAPPPPPPPDPPYIAAAKSRPKIPFWAMGALSLLPIWMFMYVRSLTQETEEAAGSARRRRRGLRRPARRATARSGEGGVGRPFADGEVLATFPHIEDQLRFVYFGTAEYNLAGVADYGNPDREGGPHLTGSFGVMPPQGAGGRR